MNLILGTAEFNPAGYAGKPCPDEKEIVRILNRAWEGGIRTLDCAEAYNCVMLLGKYASQFEWLWKSRSFGPTDWYHYSSEEEEPVAVSRASVYSFKQLSGLTHAIVPFSIANTNFCGARQDRYEYYARSIFDRGRLLTQGYSVNDCLSFVKRHRFNGVIVGVNTEKELDEILQSW